MDTFTRIPVSLYRTNLHVVLLRNSTPNFHPEIVSCVIINLVEKENNGICFVPRAKLNSKFLVKINLPSMGPIGFKIE